MGYKALQSARKGVEKNQFTVNPQKCLHISSEWLLNDINACHAPACD